MGNHAFRCEPPTYTPTDRFQALHEVAQAARRLRASTSPAHIASELLLALDRLDQIETYLGVAPPAESPA